MFVDSIIALQFVDPQGRRNSVSRETFVISHCHSPTGKLSDTNSGHAIAYLRTLVF